MKFYETHFEEYVDQVKYKNLHPTLEKTYNQFPSHIEDLPNLLFYGPPGVGKYSQMLFSIQSYSPSLLKYEKKMCVANQDKGDYFLKISDIHYEVDMSILGCKAKSLFNEIYNQVYDSITSKQNKYGILVCKNFHNIHHELLDIFYYYMNSTKNIKFILLTEHISFISTNIQNACKLISVPKPKKIMYRKVFNVSRSDHVSNLKLLKDPSLEITTTEYADCIGIANKLEHLTNLDFLSLRENIYSLFINQYDITECLQNIIFYFIDNHQLHEDNVSEFLLKFHNFLILFNNNYRPIYHLESILLYLCRVIHGF